VSLYNCESLTYPAERRREDMWQHTAKICHSAPRRIIVFKVAFQIPLKLCLRCVSCLIPETVLFY
jgi:hypothetical protein